MAEPENMKALIKRLSVPPPPVRKRTPTIKRHTGKHKAVGQMVGDNFRKHKIAKGREKIPTGTEIVKLYEVATGILKREEELHDLAKKSSPAYLILSQQLKKYVIGRITGLTDLQSRKHSGILTCIGVADRPRVSKAIKELKTIGGEVETGKNSLLPSYEDAIREMQTIGNNVVLDEQTRLVAWTKIAQLQQKESKNSTWGKIVRDSKELVKVISRVAGVKKR